MPSFELNFEVYCDTCGNGLCGQSIATLSRNRGEPQLRVEVCDDCLEEARQEVRNDLEGQIQELQQQLAEAKEELEHWKG